MPWRAAARTAVLAALAVCAAGWAGWMWYAPTDSATLNDDAALKPLAFSSLTGEQVLALLLTWAPVLAATLLALVLRRWLTPPQTVTAPGLRTRVRWALAYQLPPRRFLADWCGGLSAGEALLVAAWLAVNAWWLGQGLARNLDAPLAAASWQERVGKTGLVFGQMLAPNLMLLFLPVPHTSLVPWLTGLSRNRLIRYHRWLGHGTMWILTTHAVLYYVYWGVSDRAGGFWDNFSLWADKGGVNNLAGSLAFFAGLVLWATALTWVRRRFFRFFWRFHVVCFLAFFLLSCAHYSSCWIYFAPGLLLYAADVALRAGQMANLTTVTAAKVERAAGVVTVQMKVDPALTLLPLQETWVLLPAISRWQWHPVTVASGGGGLMTLHIKRYGLYTKRVVEDLRLRRPATVRVAGPIGAETTPGCTLVPNHRWAAHDVLVLFGGGVGITALLSMLRAMAARRAAGGTAAEGLPRKLFCVWTARNLAEFKILDAPLLEAASAPDSWLQLRLHHTSSKSVASLAVAPLEAALTAPSFSLEGLTATPTAPALGSRSSPCPVEEGQEGDAEQGSPAGRSGSAAWGKAGSSLGGSSPEKDSAFGAAGMQPAGEVQLTRASDSSQSSGKHSEQSAANHAGPDNAAVASSTAAVAQVHRAAAGASPFFWRLLRPIQPKSFGVGHLAVVYCLTYLGAFCAVLLAASYEAQVSQWQGGLLYAVLLSAMATGLPFGLAIFPVHAYRYWCAAAAVRRGGADAQRELAAPLSEPLDDSVLLDKGALRVHGSGAAVPVLPGRPDFEGLLRSVAQTFASSCDCVGVYAGGPKGMMTAVHLAVARLNATSHGTHYELHREAVEL